MINKNYNRHLRKNTQTLEQEQLLRISKEQLDALAKDEEDFHQLISAVSEDKPKYTVITLFQWTYGSFVYLRLNDKTTYNSEQEAKDSFTNENVFWEEIDTELIIDNYPGYFPTIAYQVCIDETQNPSYYCIAEIMLDQQTPSIFANENKIDDNLE